MDDDVMKQENEELKELLNSAYEIIEIYPVQGKYNIKWKQRWLKKARDLIPNIVDP